MRVLSLVRLVIISAFAALAMAPVSWAQRLGSELYVVENISSDAEALTSSDANVVALRNASLIGLREVFSRIVPAEHRGRIRVPSEDQLRLMIAGSTLRESRGGISSYSLVADFEYDKASVHAYLQEQGVPFVDREPQALLVVPHLTNLEGQSVLFDASNDWYAAWQDASRTNAVQWQVVEQGDLPEGATSDLTSEFRAVEAVLASKSLAGGYIVRMSQLDVGHPEVPGVSVQALKVGQALGPARVDLSYQPEEDTANVRALYARAISELTRQVTESWVSQSPAIEPRVNTINIVALGIDPDTWFNLSNQLVAEPLILDARYIGPRTGALDVSMQFTGGLLDLQELLTARGYLFEAYSLESRPDVIGFLLQPNRLVLPNGVRILDLSQIRLNYN